MNGWRRLQRQERDAIVAFLRDRFGAPFDDGGYLLWPCPWCDNDPALTLRVAPAGALSWLVATACCHRGDAELLSDFVGETAANGRVLLVESFAEVHAQPTRWLWRSRIPLGAVSLLVGREKLGKSTLTVELAARASRGDLDGDLLGEPARTLIVSYEDNGATTIKPRLVAAGADVEFVSQLRAETDGAPDLVSLPGDVERIGEIACELGVRLIVVDPLSASLGGGIDSHRDQDVRRALAPLARLAEAEGLAVVAVGHWNKAQSIDPLSRVLGSRGLTAAARSVLAFGQPPDAPEGSPERVLAHVACNVGPEAPSLACRVEGRHVLAGGETLDTSRLVLGGEVDLRASDLLATRNARERTETDEASEWLADELTGGAWHRSADVKDRAKEHGISGKTLRRARERLGIEARRNGFPAISEWRLPVVPLSSTSQGTTA